MFATMMEGIKEESVGFLFNLEVQVDAAPAAAPAAPAVAPKTADPQKVLRDLAEAEKHQADPELAAEESEGFAPAGEPDTDDDGAPAARPAISAKGLDRDKPASKMIYTAPTMDADEVGQAEVRVGSSDGSPEEPKASPNGSKRPAQKSNPNRGSRGNRSGSNRNNRSRKR